MCTTPAAEGHCQFRSGSSHRPRYFQGVFCQALWDKICTPARWGGGDLAGALCCGRQLHALASHRCPDQADLCIPDEQRSMASAFKESLAEVAADIQDLARNEVRPLRQPSSPRHVPTSPMAAGSSLVHVFLAHQLASLADESPNLDISDMEGHSQLPGRFGRLEALRDQPYRLACEPVVTSSRTLEGLDHLAAVLAGEAESELEASASREVVPKTWCLLSDLVLRRRRQGTVIVSWADFEQLKGSAGFARDAEVNFRQAVRYLSSTGVVLWFPDILPDTVFISPQWIIELLLLCFRHDYDALYATAAKDLREAGCQSSAKAFRAGIKDLQENGRLSQSLLADLLALRVAEVHSAIEDPATTDRVRRVLQAESDGLRQEGVVDLLPDLLRALHLAYAPDVGDKPQGSVTLPWFLPAAAPRDAMQRWDDLVGGKLPVDLAGRVVQLNHLPAGLLERVLVTCSGMFHSLHASKEGALFVPAKGGALALLRVIRRSSGFADVVMMACTTEQGMPDAENSLTASLLPLACCLEHLLSVAFPGVIHSTRAICPRCLARAGAPSSGVLTLPEDSYFPLAGLCTQPLAHCQACRLPSVVPVLLLHLLSAEDPDDRTGQDYPAMALQQRIQGLGEVQVTSLSQVFVQREECLDDAGDGFGEWSVVDVCESAETSFASVLSPERSDRGALEGFGGAG